MAVAAGLLTAAIAAKLGSALFGSGYSKEHKKAVKDITREKRESFLRNLEQVGELKDLYGAEAFEGRRAEKEAELGEELTGAMGEQYLNMPLSPGGRGRTGAYMAAKAGETHAGSLKDAESMAALNAIAGAFKGGQTGGDPIRSQRALENLGSRMRIGEASRHLQDRPSRSTAGQLFDFGGDILGAGAGMAYAGQSQKELADYLAGIEASKELDQLLLSGGY